MTKILVVHGAGMNMRGKVQIDVFGPMTLADYDKHISAYAEELGLEIEIFHSNIEGEVVNKFYEAAEKKNVDAAIFNPGGFTRGYPALIAAIAQCPFPTVEVHISNPAMRGTVSEIARSTKHCIAGFGVAGYKLAFQGLKEALAAKK